MDDVVIARNYYVVKSQPAFSPFGDTLLLLLFIVRYRYRLDDVTDSVVTYRQQPLAIRRAAAEATIAARIASLLFMYYSNFIATSVAYSFLYKKVSMNREAEHTLLIAAHTRALDRKKKAQQSVLASWQQYTSARDAMNAASDEQQAVYLREDDAWQNYMSVLDTNSPQLKEQQRLKDRADKKAKKAFDKARSYPGHRGTSKRMETLGDGYHYSGDSMEHDKACSRLEQTISCARTLYDQSIDATKLATDALKTCQRVHELAWTEYERSSVNQARADAEYTSLTKAVDQMTVSL